MDPFDVGRIAEFSISPLLVLLIRAGGKEQSPARKGRRDLWSMDSAWDTIQALAKLLLPIYRVSELV